MNFKIGEKVRIQDRHYLNFGILRSINLEDKNPYVVETKGKKLMGVRLKDLFKG